MEQIRLFDSELRLMELVWRLEPTTAKALSLVAAEELRWNKNTTYTVLTKLVDKGIVERSEPNFTCTSLVKREDVQRAETKSLIDKLFHGSKKSFFAAFLQDESLSEEELQELRELIDQR